MKKLSQLLVVMTGVCLPVLILLMSVQTLPANSEIEKIMKVENKSDLEKKLEVILDKTKRFPSFNMSKYEF